MQLDTTPARPDLPPMKLKFAPNPNFGNRPGTELLVSARTSYQDTAAWTRTRWGVWRDPVASVKHLPSGSFDDAVTAATELLAIQRTATKWGFFNRNQGRVDALAILQAGSGWDLVRVDTPVDTFVEPVPGAMAPWQKWTVTPMRSVFGEGDVRRERADVVALVGATHVFDLRATTPSGPTEPA